MDQLGQSMQNPMPHDPNNRPAEFLGYSKGEYRLIWSRARQLIQFSLKPRCTERESHEVLAQTAQEPGSQVIANRRWYIGSRRAVRGARDIIRGRGRRGVLSSQRILSGYDMQHCRLVRDQVRYDYCDLPKVQLPGNIWLGANTCWWMKQVSSALSNKPRI